MIEVINNVGIYEKYLPVFGKEEYLKYKSDKYGWFISGQFLLPFYITKKFIFKRLFFTTNTIYLKDASKDDEKTFLNDVCNKTRSLGVDVIDVPQVNAIFNVCPDRAISTEFGTYKIDLSLSKDELFSKVHSKHRNVIRKAEKDGVVIKKDDSYILDCYELIKETYKRQNKKFISYDNFERLKLLLKDDLVFYVTLKDEVIQGCAVFIWNKGHSCFYQYGGSISTPSTGAMNLLHWKAICDMEENGVCYYDLYGARISPEPGSKLEGIQRFKERFGGDFITGFLWKYPVKKYKYLLYKVLLRIHNLLKGIKYEGDIIDQERRRKQKAE